MSENLLSRKDVQFVVWIICLVIAGVIPFVTYGNKIKEMEIRQQELITNEEKMLNTLHEIDKKQAIIQIDIEYIKKSIEKDNNL